MCYPFRISEEKVVNCLPRLSTSNNHRNHWTRWNGSQRQQAVSSAFARREYFSTLPCQPIFSNFIDLYLLRQRAGSYDDGTILANSMANANSPPRHWTVLIGVGLTVAKAKRNPQDLNKDRSLKGAVQDVIALNEYLKD